MAKKTVYEIGADVSKLVNGLKQVKDQFKDIDKTLSQGIRVKIDLKQFMSLQTTLRTGFRETSGHIASEFRKVGKQITDSLKESSTAFKAIEQAASRSGQNVSQTISKAISSGATAGANVASAQLREITSRLDAQFNATVRAYEARISRLGASARTLIQSDMQARGMGLNEDFLISRSMKKDGSPGAEFLNPERVGDIRRLVEEYEKASRAKLQMLETSRKAEMENARSRGLAETQHVKLLDEQIARMRLITDAKEAENAAIAKERRGVEVAHQKALESIRKQEEAEARRQRAGQKYASDMFDKLEQKERREKAASERAIDRENKLDAASARSHARFLERQKEKEQAATRVFNRLQGQAERANVAPASIGLKGSDQFLGAPGRGLNKNEIAKVEEALRNAKTQAAHVRKNLADADSEAKKLLKTKRGIGDELTRSVSLMAKWLIFFRLVRDTTQAIEMAIKSVVVAGFQFLEQSELQKLALSASLNEHFKIKDAQGQLVEGAASLNILQGVANEQWSVMQRAALSVVGSTQDLMDIYVSILPQISRLGGGLEEAQHLTKSTAIAASLLKVPFQDARTAVLALLQGRVLTRNRLVAALGLDSDDLKNSATRFKVVEAALDSYAKVGDRAAKTFGAMKESFKEFMGMVGAQFTGPFVDLFKRAMTGSNGKGGIQGLLFDKDNSDTLKLKEDVEFMFAVIRGSMREVTADLTEFGKHLVGQGGKDVQVWVRGIANGTRALMEFAQGVVTVMVKMTTFAAQNSATIITLAKLALVVAAFQKMRGLGGWYTDLLKSGQIVVGVVQNLAVKLGLLTQATGQLTAAQTAANSAGSMFLGTLKNMAIGGVIAVAVAGLGFLISRYIEVKEAAKAAAEAQALVAQGRVFDAAAKNAKNLNSEDPITRANALRATFGQGANVTSELLNKTIGGPDGWARLIQEQTKLYKELESGTLSDAERKKAAARIEALEEQKELATGYFNELKLILQSENQWISTAEAVREKARQLYKEAEEAKLQQAATGGEIGADVLGKLQEATRADQIALGLQKNLSQFLGYKAAVAAHAAARRAAETPSSIMPRPQEPEDETRTDRSWTNQWDERLKQALSVLELLEEQQQIMRKNELISEEEMQMNILAIQRERIDTQMRMYDKMEEDLDEHVNKIWRSGKNPLTEAEAKKKGTEYRAGIEARRTEAQTANTLLNFRVGADESGRQAALARLRISAQNDVDGLLATIFGDSEEKVETQIQNLIETIERQFAGLKERGEGQKLTQQLRDVVESAKAYRQLTKDVEVYNNQVNDLTANQERLDRQFATGRLSVAQYAESTRQNDADQIAALRSERAGLTQLMTLERDPSRLAQYASRIREINSHLESLEDTATRAMVAARGLTAALGDVANSLATLDVDGTGVMTNIAQGFNQAMGLANQFAGTVDSVRGAMAKAKAAGLSGGTGFLSAFSGGLGMKDGAATGLSAAIGGAFLGAGAAISIATALYTRAVEKAKESMSESINEVTKALGNGVIGLADAQRRLEAERAAAVRRFSSSKSGRAALKEMLPQFDQQLEEVQKRIEQVRKSFDEKLRDLNIGDGPYADFARMLFDLEATTKEYLATFEYGSKEYNEALRNVADMFNLTLNSAKKNLVSQMDSFNADALSSAFKVLDLIEEQAGLYEQLADTAERRLALDEEAAELAKENEEEWAEFSEKREDHAKKILEIEDKIRDVMRQALLDEAEIRRRGVLEAQESIAVTKAREITDARNKARDELSDLRDQLAEEKRVDFAEEEEELRKNQEKRLKSLQKEYTELDKQVDKLNEQLKLNNIRLKYAEQIRDIEGSIFDISGNRYDLEEKMGRLQLKQAQDRVEKWKEVQDLIDAIVENGEGIIFNPPPGFPQIRVQIGDININTSNTTNNTGGSGGSNGGGSGRGPAPGGGGPRGGRGGNTNLGTGEAMTRAERQGLS